MKISRASLRVIILHGWTTSKEKWGPLLTELKKSSQVEILDIPVLTSKADRAWTLDDYVNWLNDLLAKEKQPVVLIGHSNGGRIALKLASQNPQQISKLILIDSAGIYHNELPLRLKRLVFDKIAKVGKSFKEHPILRKVFYKIIGESDYRDGNLLQRQTMINLINQDLKDVLKDINIPTLIIWGEKDNITPLKDGLLMNQQIKNSQLLVVGSAGHSPHFSHTRKVVEKIREFVK